MSRSTQERDPLGPEAAVIIGALVTIGLLLVINAISGQSVRVLSNPAQTSFDQETPDAFLSPTSLPVATESASLPLAGAGTSTATPTPRQISVTLIAAVSPTVKPLDTPTPTVTPTPSNTPTPTQTPTPTRDLARCNAAGCGLDAKPVPTLEYGAKLLLRHEPLERRACGECPGNERLSERELDALVGINPAAIAQLRTIALSQQPYQIAPGVVYLVSDYVHHVVVDLKESGHTLRNIIPPIPDPETRENIRITPSYCLSPESLVVMTADYHGLVGSNKTENGRSIFFHLGRAALFQLDGEFDIDVIREDSVYDQTTISWGGGPIIMWDGAYDFNPEQEWFTPENLDHYENTTWSKMVVAVSDDRRYLFLSASFDITLKEHAENVINLGEKWGINVDRAMRFDGSESAYLAIRLGDYMAPVLGIEEPLIVNCLAVEQDGKAEFDN